MKLVKDNSYIQAPGDDNPASGRRRRIRLESTPRCREARSSSRGPLRRNHSAASAMCSADLEVVWEGHSSLVEWRTRETQGKAGISSETFMDLTICRRPDTLHQSGTFKGTSVGVSPPDVGALVPICMFSATWRCLVLGKTGGGSWGPGHDRKRNLSPSNI